MSTGTRICILYIVLEDDLHVSFSHAFTRFHAKAWPHLKIALIWFHIKLCSNNFSSVKIKENQNTVVHTVVVNVCMLSCLCVLYSISYKYIHYDIDHIYRLSNINSNAKWNDQNIRCYSFNLAILNLTLWHRGNRERASFIL